MPEPSDTSTTIGCHNYLVTRILNNLLCMKTAVDLWSKTFAMELPSHMILIKEDSIRDGEVRDGNSLAIVSDHRST